jgi:hypothetical protein
MKENIKRILREDTGGDPTKLSVFDFDGTTVDTGTPETHKPIWKEKTGTDWPHVGWWGRKESLDMSVFDFKAKPEVKSDYMKERSNPDTMVISLTGRRPKLGNEVKAILDANGYNFDAYLYNYGADTLSNKLEQLGKILSEMSSIVSVELWDDRVDHFKTFQQWGKGLVDSGRLEHFHLHKVPNPQWTK